MASKTMRVDILGDAQRLRKELQQAERDLAGFGKEADDAGKEVKGLQGIVDRFDVGSLATGAGFAAFGATMDDAKVSAGQLRAQLGLMPDEAKEFEAVARQVYRNNFGDSMQDAFQATGRVTQALGLQGDQLQSTTEDIFRISDAFEHVGADAQIITEDVRALRGAFPGEDEEMLLDRIADAFQNGTGSAGDLQDTLQEYPGLFADLGLNAGDMFNILNSGMEAGARNTDVVADAVKEFGIRVKTAGDTGQEALKEMFPPEEAHRLITAFSEGGEAGREAFYTVAEQLLNTRDEQERYNLAVELFGTKAEDLGPALRPMLEGLVAAKDTTGEVRDATGLLDQQYAGIRATFESFKRSLQTSIIAPMGDVAGVFGGGVEAAGNLGAAFFGLKSAGVDVSQNLGRVKDAALGSFGAVRNLAGAAGLGALGIAVGVGTTLLAKWVTSKREAEQVTEDFVRAIEADTGAIGENTREVVVNRLERDGLLEKAQRLGVDLEVLTDAVLGETDAREKLNRKMEEYRVQADGTSDADRQATQDARELTGAVDFMAGSFEEARTSAQRKTEAVGKATEATNTQTDAAGDLESQTDDLSEALENETEKVDSLTDAVDLLAGAHVDETTAAINYEEQIDVLSETLKENGATTDITTEKGRKNMRQLYDTRDAIVEHIDKLLEQGGTYEEVRPVLEAHIEQLRKEMRQAGFTDEEINKLIRSMGLIPEEISTQFKTPGLVNAIRTARTLKEALEAVPRQVSIQGFMRAEQLFRGGSGLGVGATVGMPYRGMFAALRSAFPGANLISGYRRGAVTSTGRRSWHALGRAIDFNPSRGMAEWVHRNFKSKTKELITPWQDLNLFRGRPHRYSDGIMALHDGRIGVRHNHWAMARGGFGTVSRPSHFLAGEAGVPEDVMVIPHSKGGFAGVIRQALQDGLQGAGGVVINGDVYVTTQDAGSFGRDLRAAVRAA